MSFYRERKLRSGNSMVLGTEVIHGKSSFQPGLLPKVRSVMEVMMEMLMPRGKGYTQLSKMDAAERVGQMLHEHWVWCNIYPKYVKNVSKQVLDCWLNFKQMVSCRKERQTDKWKKEKLEPYMEMFNNSLFDISSKDPAFIKKQEDLTGVKMTELEADFLQDQKGPQLMYCESFVDRKWLTMDTRRRKDREEQAKRQDQSKKDIIMMAPVKYSDENEECEDDEKDKDFNILDDEGNETTAKKKRKFEGIHLREKLALPMDWEHIRHSHHKVREEYFRVVDLLMSKYHMSMSQAVASVVWTGRIMFGRSWCFHEEGEKITVDTVPQASSARRIGKGLEVFTLAKLCEKILSCDDKRVTVTYHDDGSRTQGAGSYSVQGISLQGEFFPLPTLPISSETRENLAALKLTVLEVLATCGNTTMEELWSRTDFIMTDSVSHNLEVENLVSDELDMEYTPGHLLCHTHPALMFSRILCNVFKSVDTTIGVSKVFAGFAVTITDIQTSVTEQFIDVTLRLVSHDFDHKMWNKASEFDIYIKPKKNTAKRLQKERFNSLVYCCAVALYLDADVLKFLEKFTNITNTLACIVRSFSTLDYVRVLAAVGVIVGIHIVEPFLSLTTSTKTDYSKLQESFPKLYTDLCTVKPELLLDLTSPALSFVSKERFQACLYTDELLEPTKAVIENNRTEVVKVLIILLPQLAAGWSKQRGAVFGFGPDADKECSTKVSDQDQEKLKCAPINNLDPERSVGYINYELGIRGAKQLGAASSALVKGKGHKLIERLVMDKKYVKMAAKDGEVVEIMKKWSESQQKMKEDGMEVKEMSNLQEEQKRHADLTELVRLGGPFTTAEQVDEFMDMVSIKEEDKNKRLYIEVRHAKATSVCFPKQSTVFRLKKDYKNLSNDMYAENLKAFLKKVTCHIDMTNEDFKDALKSLTE